MLKLGGLFALLLVVISGTVWYLLSSDPPASPTLTVPPAPQIPGGWQQADLAWAQTAATAPAAPNQMLVCGGAQGEIYSAASVDGGNTWSAATPVSGGHVCQATINPNKANERVVFFADCLAGCPWQGERSTDSGHSWQRLAFPSAAPKKLVFAWSQQHLYVALDVASTDLVMLTTNATFVTVPELPHHEAILNLIGTTHALYVKWSEGWYALTNTGEWGSTNFASAGHALSPVGSSLDGQNLIVQSMTQLYLSHDDGQTWQPSARLPDEPQAQRAVLWATVTGDGTWIAQFSYVGSIGESGGYAAIFINMPASDSWERWVFTPVSGEGMYTAYWVVKPAGITTDVHGKPEMLWAAASYNARKDGPWLVQTALTGTPP